MAEEDIIFGKNRHLFGGLEPSNMRKFESGVMVDGQRAIVYQLPTDTVIDGQTLCTVEGVMIRRKTDGYPINEFDGDLVRDVKIDKLDNPNDVYWLVDEDAVFGGDGIWVAATEGNGIYYSEDGKNWEQSNITNGYWDIYHENGMLYASGMDFTTYTQFGLWYSEDGKTWTQSNITNVFAVVLSANGLWIAGGADFMTYTGIGFYYSEDGKTWTQSNVTNALSLGTVLYIDGTYIISDESTGIYYSEDGKTWTQSNITEGEFYLYYHDDVLVARDLFNGIYYSEDGKTWIRSNVTTSDKYYIIYYSDGLWVAGTANNGILYSNNGKTWEQSNIVGCEISTISYLNGLWITGNVYNNTSIVYYSEDGKTWTQSNLTNAFKGFYYVNNLFFAAGNECGLYYSENGKNWTQTNITSADIDFVYYRNGEFVASGEGNHIYYSQDGKTWTPIIVLEGGFSSVSLVENASEGADAFYYSAFPYTTRGVYNRNESNRFMISKPEPEAPEEPARGYLFGYDLDTTDSDPATRVSYPSDVDNAAFAAAYMDYTAGAFNYGGWNITPGEQFMPKPCMLKYDGTVDHYLDYNDYSKKVDGTVSSVALTSFDGNAMMEWPKIYTKRWEENGIYHFRCSDVKIDDDYECWCNYDINNNEIDHFYTAIYQGSNESSKLRSISGRESNGGIAVESLVNYAIANSSDWYIDVLADVLLIQDLLVMMGKSTDGQSVYGNGNVNGDSYLNSGAMNDKGMFFGTQDTTSCVKVFGMENRWGNYARRVAGWIFDKGVQKVKLTRGTYDGSTAADYNTTGSGYITLDGVTLTGTSDGYISAMKTMPYGRIPIAASGTSTTYESDTIMFSTSGVYYATTGGYRTGTMKCGPFHTRLSIMSTSTTSTFGAALSCKPSAVTE